MIFLPDLGAFQFDNGSCDSCDQKEVPCGLMKLVKPVQFFEGSKIVMLKPHILGAAILAFQKTKMDFQVFLMEIFSFLMVQLRSSRKKAH